MSAPQRIQLSRRKGYRKPEGAVVVARPSKWGNPFAYRTNYGLARVPGACDPNAEWEYEGRISGHGARHDVHHPDGRITVCNVRYMTRAEVVETFRLAVLGLDTPSMRAASPSGRGRWLGYWTGTSRDRRREYVTVEDIRREMAGKDLCCWCPLDQPCHADVLLEVANAPEDIPATYEGANRD